MKTDSLLEDANNGSSQENTVGEKHSTTIFPIALNFLKYLVIFIFIPQLSLHKSPP